MSPERPINAEMPSTEEAERPPPQGPESGTAPPPESQTAPPPESRTAQPAARPAPPPRRRRRVALTPLLLGLLVVLAILFILAAVVGGSGGGRDDSGTEATAPAAGEGVAAGLGFPLTATNNTTRVGGADPAAIAAAVALAVYPATTPSQRPNAVTLVDEENWAGAIAAAVLMAPPVGAPVIFRAGGSLPAASEEALAALRPKNRREISSPEPAAAALEAAKIRDRLAPKPPAHIVLAPEGAPEYAMPAAAWAARSGDPVLFAGGDDLPPETVAYLEAHTKAPIFVLGPPSEISPELTREAERIAGPVTRVPGDDPVAAAVALARFGEDGFGWDVNDPGHGFVLVRSGSPLNAAAAAPLSASGTWGPLLLTDDADTLPAEVRDYFLDVKPGYTDNPTRAFYNHVWVIGDQEAIDVKQQAEANELAELERIGGE